MRTFAKQSSALPYMMVNSICLAHLDYFTFFCAGNFWRVNDYCQINLVGKKVCNNQAGFINNQLFEYQWDRPLTLTLIESMSWVTAYLMFILWVLKPSRGSSTKPVARSSVSHSSFTLILVHPSIASHHQHATVTVSKQRYNNNNNNNKPQSSISCAA